MRKRGLRIASLLVCIVMLLSVFAACGNNSEKATSTSTAAQSATPEATASTPADDGKMDWTKDTSAVTMDLFVNMSGFVLNWTDPAAARMKAKTGVTLNIMKPSADDNQKINIMIASNALPDIVVTDLSVSSVINNIIGSNQAMAIEDLIDQYAPKFNTILRKEILTNYKTDDGKTYCIPSYVEGEDFQREALNNNALVNTNQMCFVVRKDYYDEIGRPAVNTPDALISALEQMKAKHPDKIGFYAGDGSLNTLGKTNRADQNPFLQEFGIQPYYVKDGALQYFAKDPQYLEYMKFMNKLQIKGLLTKESFIDKNEVFTQKVNAGKVIAYSANTVEDGKVPADNKNTSYEVLQPFDTYKNIRYGTGWTGCFITKNAKKPDRAIRFIEYLYSEEGMTDWWYGIEAKDGEKYSGDVVKGPHWYMDNGKPQFFPEYWAAKNADWGGVATKNGLGEYWFVSDTLREQIITWNPKDEKMKKWNDMYGKYVEYKPEFYGIDPDVQTAEGAALTKVNDLLMQKLPKIIYAKDEAGVVGEYNKMIKDMDALGLPTAEQKMTEVWKKKTASMGK